MAFATTLSDEKETARTLAEAYDPALHKARLAFLSLILFTGVLYGRPQDFVVALRPLHVAQIVAAMAIFTYGIAVLQGRAPFVFTTEVKIVLGLTVLYVMGVPFAYWRQGALDTLTDTWLKTLIIFILLTQTVYSIDRVRKLVWSIILCELLVSGASILNPDAARGSEQGTRMEGATYGFLSGNYLGIAAATTLPFIAALLIRTRSPFKRVALIATFGLMLWMVILTASRASILAVMFSLVLVWIFVLKDSLQARLLGFAFVFIISMGMMFAPKTFWDRFSTLYDTETVAESKTSESAEGSENQRKALFWRSIMVGLQNPIFGVGIGNFAVVSGGMTGNAQEWKGTHNSYTQVMSEAGIPAFFLFVGLLVTSAMNMHKITKECGKDPRFAEMSMLCRATLCSIYCFMFTAFFAHIAYDYFLYYLAGFGVALQAAWAHTKKTAVSTDEVSPVPITSRWGYAGGSKFL